MLKQRLNGGRLTKLVILLSLFTGITSTQRVKRQIIFEDDRENRLFTSECQTGDRRFGNCIPLTSCVTLLQTVRWNRSTFLRYFCGFDGDEPKVCCPQSGSQVTTPRIKQKSPSTTTRTILTTKTTLKTTTNPRNRAATNNSTARNTTRTKPTPRSTSRTTHIPRTTSRTIPTFKTTSRNTPTLGGTVRTTPNPRTTLSTTFRTTTRRQTSRTTIRLPGDSRHDESEILGTTLRPTIDKTRNSSFLPQICGKSLPPQQRVLGSTVAEKESWPWMAVVSKKTRSGVISPDCGGALITDRHVVTAANCVVIGQTLKPLNPSRIVVRLGAHNLIVPDEPGAIDVDVDDIRLHEQYDARTFRNNIAVLKLKETVIFTKTIAPVCLPYDSLRHEDLTSRAAYVIGFGTTSFEDKSSDVLMQAGFYIQSQKVCERAYESHQLQITRAFLCAGMMDGSKDACQGDSGGPLLTEGNNSSFYLVGIVSFGKDCGLPNYPEVYTRVTEFLDWLSKNLTD